MERKDGKRNGLENMRFSDLRTTGMILKEIEKELIPQTVVNTGKLSDRVQLGEWNPWHYSTEKIEEEKKLSSINFLVERILGKKINREKVII
ncbi:MAG: hypothetical protein CL983_00090 [Euryarchaeota archaeon]|nr:hypothetical protein [Euryarchaeota archaeon]|tara:strand:+ start:144 stop:419 length:276 start_codon:yes stop_codon:yes gene_type:complete